MHVLDKGVIRFTKAEQTAARGKKYKQAHPDAHNVNVDEYDSEHAGAFRPFPPHPPTARL